MFGRKKRTEQGNRVTIEQIAEGVTLSSKNGDVSISIGDVATAKRTIKQLKIKKKELALEKRAVNAEMQALRAARRGQVANQMPMMRGGGK